MTDIIVDSQVEVTFDHLRGLLGKELTYIEPNHYCTIRGLGRLLNIQTASLCDSRLQKNGVPRGVLKRLVMCSPEDLPESLKPVAGFDYTVISPNAKANFKANKDTSLLPEVVVASIIKYYAYDARTTLQRAKQLDLLMTTVGVRTFFQQVSINNQTELKIHQKAEVFKPQHAEPLPGILIEVDKPSSCKELKDATQDFHNQLADLTYVLRQVESLRLKREEIIFMLKNIGLLSNSGSSNGVVNSKLVC